MYKFTLIFIMLIGLAECGAVASAAEPKCEITNVPDYKQQTLNAERVIWEINDLLANFDNKTPGLLAAFQFEMSITPCSNAFMQRSVLNPKTLAIYKGDSINEYLDRLVEDVQDPATSIMNTARQIYNSAVRTKKEHE